METTQTRLLEFVASTGLNEHQFGIKCGLSTGLLGKIKNNGTDFRSDTLSKILESFPNLNTDWLLTGQGSMHKNMHGFMHGLTHGFDKKQNETIQKQEEESVQGFLPPSAVSFGSAPNQVYFIDEAVRAGLVVGFSQENTKNLAPISIPWLGKGIFYVFNVRGDSMYPTLSNGDKVLAKQVMNIQYIRSGEIYVWLTDDGMVIKRYSHNELDQVILLSDNEETYSKPLIVDSKRIMGVFEIVERNTSNLGKNNNEKQQLKLYKALLDANGIKI
jgi:phage repressor protein C with HTH and peptisase S24 domain